MIKTWLICLLVGMSFVVAAQTDPPMVQLESPEDHALVVQVKETFRETILTLRDGKKVKFNNLYPVEFYHVPTSELVDSRLYFKVYKGPNDVRDGVIRVENEVTAVLVKTIGPKGDIIWSGQRRMTEALGVSKK